MQSTEVWRQIPGHDGYEASAAGQIRSLERVVMRSNGAPQTIHARVLKQFRQGDYPAVGVDGPKFVHRLVALAFLGEGGPGYEVCHSDGNPLNNHVSNLRWGTRSDNMQDALMHGTHHNAAKTHCDRGHEFTDSNTRYAKGGSMRVCIACRKRKEPCPKCGEMRSHYGMKSHLAWVHGI